MIDEKALEAATLAALNDHRVRKGWPAIISVDGLREQDRADWTDDARAAITAYLQALRPGSTGETDGWVLVPKEPREEQIEAMREAYRNSRRNGISGMTIEAQFRAEYAPEFAAYRAMLAAAGGREG